jgi:hypothetical protein
MGAALLQIGGSSSGRTMDSDSVNLGSNPSPPAKIISHNPKSLFSLVGEGVRRPDEGHMIGLSL